MKITLISIGAICAMALGACQISSSPEKTADRFLKSLQANGSGKTETACWPQDDKSEYLPTAVKDWQITGQREATDPDDPQDRYVEVTAIVEAVGVGVPSVSRTWTLQVWKSDEFYESRKRSTDRTNQLLAEGHKVLVNSSQFTGNTPPPLKLITPSDRSKISSQPYCVLTMEPVGG